MPYCDSLSAGPSTCRARDAAANNVVQPVDTMVNIGTAIHDIAESIHQPPVQPKKNSPVH